MTFVEALEGFLFTTPSRTGQRYALFLSVPDRQALEAEVGPSTDWRGLLIENAEGPSYVLDRAHDSRLIII